MEEYVGILRDGELIDLAPIDIMDGGRERKNDIALRTARRKYGNNNSDRKCHVRSHYTSDRRVTELPLRNHQKHEKSLTHSRRVSRQTASKYGKETSLS